MGKIVWKSNKDKFETIGYLEKPRVIHRIETTVPKDRLSKFIKIGLMTLNLLPNLSKNMDFAL